MRIKIAAIILVLAAIILLIFFGFGMEERAIKGIISKVPEYNCGANNLCTSCLVEGEACSCGQQTCACGDRVVDRKECVLA